MADLEKPESDSVNFFLKDVHVNKCSFCKQGTLKIAGKCGISSIHDDDNLSKSAYFLLYMIKCTSCNLVLLLPPSYVKDHLEINNKEVAKSIKI